MFLRSPVAAQVIERQLFHIQGTRAAVRAYNTSYSLLSSIRTTSTTGLDAKGKKILSEVRFADAGIHIRSALS